MVAYVRGDRAAFGMLFARFAPRLRAFFANSFGRGTIVQDLIQTTFMKLHDSRHRYDGAQRLRPWLFTIASRVRLDALRQRYRHLHTLTEVDVDTLEGPFADGDRIQEANETAQRVRDAVVGLPEGQRIVVHLHRFEGLSFAEIAIALGIEEGTVRVRAHRAYGKLRASLADRTERAEGGVEDAP